MMSCMSWASDGRNAESRASLLPSTGVVSAGQISCSTLTQALRAENVSVSYSWWIIYAFANPGPAGELSAMPNMVLCQLLPLDEVRLQQCQDETAVQQKS